MTHSEKRCRKCKTRYMYQGSGHGCDDPLNDDRYCPECMVLINEALKDVTEKFRPKFLPVLPDTLRKPITIEDFNRAHDELRRTALLMTYPCLFGLPDIRAEDCEIHGVTFRKWVARKTGEEILTAQYEVNEAGEVTGTW